MRKRTPSFLFILISTVLYSYVLGSCSTPDEIIIYITTTPEPTITPSPTPDIDYGPKVHDILASFQEDGVSNIPCNGQEFNKAIYLGHGSCMVTIANMDSNCSEDSPFSTALLSCKIPIKFENEIPQAGEWIRNSVSNIVHNRKAAAEIHLWLDANLEITKNADVIGDYLVKSNIYFEGLGPDYILRDVVIENLKLESE